MTAVAVGLPPTLVREDGIHVRRAEIVGVTDEGQLDLKIAPYEVEVELVPGLSEIVTRGAFASAVGNPTRVKISNQGHDMNNKIGHAVEIRDEEDGIYGRFTIPDTALGRDVLTLIRAGTLTEVSAEFSPQDKFWKRIRRPDGSTLWRHDRATLVGVSPVGMGAYGEEARVLSVREAARLSAKEKAIAQLTALDAGPKRV